jgi:shikimate dehydrogenase
MHNAALKACGVEMEYVRVHLRPPELQEGFTLLNQNGFIGVNFTIPHKTAVISLLDSVDPRAERLGAVNTVRFDGGKSCGYNTDGPGLARAVTASFGVRLGDLKAMVIGAGGGAGRAAAIQCALEGCREITLVNRTLSKAEALSQYLQDLTTGCPALTIHAMEDTPKNISDAMSHTDIVLQCSSLGMANEDPSPIPKEAIGSHHLIYDTIYSRRTKLIQDAEARGARSANGLSMLLYQGALAFEIWLQRPAPIEAMNAALVAVARIKRA